MQLWQQSALDLVRALRARHVSAREAAAAAIARIEQTQKTVNAIATNRFEQALDEATAFDQGNRTAAPISAQLAGLPIIIKDMTEVVGLPTTLGDPRRANTPAPRSDLCVERLERNGGIVLAKSNVPYMGLGYDTTNPLFGTTLNPWNTGRSTGGSSGGAAAALACGAAWLAHGTDLGGSIRGPAGNCGVVGLRPTPGLVAHGGIDTRRYPVEDQSLDGPMARNVADCALFLDAMSGASPEDPLSMPADSAGYLSGALDPMLPTRAAISADLGVAVVDPAVRSILAEIARRLEEEGVEMIEDGPPCDGIADAAYDLRLAWTRRRTTAAEFELQRPHMAELAAKTWLDAQSLTIERMLAAQTRQQRLIDDMRRLFRRADCLIIPANPLPPAPIGSAGRGRRSTAEGVHWVHDSVLAYTITLSWCPSLSIPAGLTNDGLPVGIQIVGPPRSERRLFQFGAAIERIVGIAQRLPLEPIVAAAGKETLEP